LLAEQLAQARLVAAVEMASADTGGTLAIHGDEAAARADTGRAGARYQS
jgi:hypothetical protein